MRWAAAYGGSNLGAQRRNQLHPMKLTPKQQVEDMS